MSSADLGCCVVAHIVVRSALGSARGQWQYGLRPIQRLDLALFVHTQHHGLQGWIQVHTHDVAPLLHEQRVAGEIEGSWLCGCKPKARQMRVLGRVAPSGRLQRGRDHRVHTRIVDAARRTRTKPIELPIQAMFDKARAPIGDGLGRDPLAHGNRLVLHPVGTAQHDACSQCHGCAVLRRSVKAVSCSRFASLSTSSVLGLPLIATTSCSNGTRLILTANFI